MFHKLLLASLLALTSSTTTIASAEAPAPRPSPLPANNGCLLQTVVAPPVFRIDDVPDAKTGRSSSLVVLSNGAWSFTETQDGKLLRSAAGCLSLDEVRALDTVLAGASWTTSVAKVRCMAVAFATTKYSYKGAVKLARRLCDGVILDASTQKALADANRMVAKLYPKT